MSTNKITVVSVIHLDEEIGLVHSGEAFQEDLESGGETIVRLIAAERGVVQRGGQGCASMRRAYLAHCETRTVWEFAQTMVRYGCSPACLLRLWSDDECQM